MKLSECVAIFWEAYSNKESEWSLSDTERFRLLETRYPREADATGRVPLLDNRIISKINGLSQEEGLPGDSLSKRKISELYDQAFLENKLLGKWDSQFTTIFSVLNTVIPASFRLKADRESVYTLASYSIDLWSAKSNYCPLPDLDNRLNYIVDAARYLKRFIRETLTIEEGGVVLSDSVMKALHSELDKRIAYAGGIPVLERLFKDKLSPRFSAKVGRYRIHREARNYYGGKGAATPEFPLGYLFQIAVKHIFYPVVDIRVRCGEGYDEIIQIAQSIMLLVDVWSDSPMAHLFVKPKDLPEYVAKNAAFDSLCIPMQYNTDFCLEILNMYKTEQERLLPELSGVESIAAWCLSLLPCTIFSVERIHNETNLPKAKIQTVLDRFSIPWEEINKQYVTPLAPTNQWSYPLIEGPFGQYFLLCPQFSGYGFCDRLYTLLHAEEKTVGRKLGKDLENFVKQLLDKKHIPYLDGLYKSKKEVAGECDLILENNKSIIFVEIKKCPLGDGFRQADDVAIFHDLADGMLAGQIQAYRHRVRIETQGYLDLYTYDNNQSPYHTLDLGNRRVHTISLCMPEYAYLTQSLQAINFLEALLIANFNTFDPKQSQKLNKLNSHAEQLRDIIQPIFRPGDNLRQFVHFSYFRSLQQFWISVQLANDLDQLIDYLTSDGTLVFSSMDFYVGLLEWIKLHQSINSMQ